MKDLEEISVHLSNNGCQASNLAVKEGKLESGGDTVPGTDIPSASTLIQS